MNIVDYINSLNKDKILKFIETTSSDITIKSDIEKKVSDTSWIDMVEESIPYLDNKNRPIRIDSRVAYDVVRNARKVLALEKRGVKVIFPDVFSIYDFLRSQIDNTHEMA